MSKSPNIIKERWTSLFSQTGQATLSPINGTIILKLTSRDIAKSSTMVRSEADESATALPGLRSTASEVIFELSISKLNLCVIQEFIQPFHLIILSIAMSSNCESKERILLCFRCFNPFLHGKKPLDRQTDLLFEL